MASMYSVLLGTSILNLNFLRPKFEIARMVKITNMIVVKPSWRGEQASVVLCVCDAYGDAFVRLT